MTANLLLFYIIINYC